VLSARKSVLSNLIPAGPPARGIVPIVVEDDGPGFDAARLPDGHGLALLRDRAGLLLGDRASLRIDSGPGGTRVTLGVPLSPASPTT
jgi:signal transduction histidine kinase